MDLRCRVCPEISHPKELFSKGQDLLGNGKTMNIEAINTLRGTPKEILQIRMHGDQSLKHQ
jgi:hypothetical protein